MKYFRVLLELDVGVSKVGLLLRAPDTFDSSCQLPRLAGLRAVRVMIG